MPVEKDCREVTLKLGGKAKFHVEHFRSDCCGIVFGPGDRFHEHADGFFCNDHFCFYCHKPISTDDPGRVEDGMLGGSLHLWCHQLTLMGSAE